MTPEGARDLVRYNTWANQRMLRAVGVLDADALRRPLGGSFPTIHATLVHILNAEWLWVERWQGRSPRELLAAEEFPTVAALATRLAQVQAAQEAVIAAASAADFARRIRYTNRVGEDWEYTLGDMLYHAVNHSTYHRGQVTNMLRILGAEPAATDFLEWRDELQ